MAVFQFTIPFLVLLGILVFVHELGHFLVAKKVGIKVLKFSLGFGPPLLSRRWGETEYLISAVPLGGYVKMFGEEPAEELDPAETRRSFSARPVWHRIGVVLAGPLMNFVLAVVVFSVLSLFGSPIPLPVIGEVSPDMPAAAAGIQSGDRVVAIDGETVETWEDLARLIVASNGEEVEVVVARGEETLTFRVVPATSVGHNLLGEEVEKPMIGVGPSGEVTVQRYPLWQAPWVGVQETVKWTGLTLDVLRKMVLGRVSPRTLGGPIAIAQMAGETARAGLLSFLFLVAVLSVNLGVLNLLPIPILDGGHILFFVIEALRGKEVSLRSREMAQQVGLVILLLLMGYVFYNDISRIVSG
jgi:regulator of sigma E protease